MITVFKYEFPITDRFTLDMPLAAEPLTVAVSPSPPSRRTGFMWCRVDTDQPVASRPFAVTGTGKPAPAHSDGAYIGPVFDGPFVWHVWAVA